MSKKILHIAALFVFAIVTTDISAATDSVAVTVNGEPIYKKQVDRQVTALIPQTSYHATVSEEKKKELVKKATENLINKELLFQYAKEQGITVSPKELSDTEDAVIKSVSGSKNLDRALAQAGITKNEFRSELYAEVAIRKLYEKKIKLTFSDSDVKEYYEKNKYKFKEPEKIDVQMIYTRNNPEDKNGTKVARKRAEDAMAKLKAGEEFALVAEKYSNDMTRVKGGNLGMIHKGRIENATAEEAAFALKKGETSSIIETDIGCFIFHLKGRKEANQLSYRSVKEKLRDELTSNREKEKMDALLESLKKQAKIGK